MEKVHIIINPCSARGQTEKRWEQIKELISGHFSEFKYLFTDKPKQATAMVRDILKRGYNLIIGIGGDGTINEIINGFFCHQSQNMINEEASLGIIPSGTGSDFMTSLKIPRDFTKSIKRIKESSIKKIDIGKISYLNDSVSKDPKYFINAADFGLGPAVVRNLSSIPPAKRGAILYYRGLFSTIKTYKSKTVSVTIDDDETITGNFLIGAIANGQRFGGGMKIAPDARIDDGLFDFVLIEDMKRFEIIWNSRRLYTGTILKHPKVIHRQVRKLSVSSAETVHIETDGELGCTLPIQIECLPSILNLRI